MQEPERARLAYVRFKKLPVGHIFLIFQDKAGNEIAFSPEAVLRDGVAFSLLRGFFRQYRLRYYDRDPKSLIQEYLENGRQVVECPLDFTPQELAQLYARVRSRATKLEHEPEWYHPICNSCVNNVINLLDDVWGKRRFLPKVLFIFAPTHLGQLYHSPNAYRRQESALRAQQEQRASTSRPASPKDPVA